MRWDMKEEAGPLGICHLGEDSQLPPTSFGSNSNLTKTQLKHQSKETDPATVLIWQVYQCM